MTLMVKQTLQMFMFLATELVLLFLLISYLVGVLQSFLTPAKIQALLSARQGKGYLIAALLGSITPFCSCSTIPFLKGLLRARAGFGPMLVFLFASPLLNPVIIGLFVVTLGLQVAVFYFLVAMTVAVVAGVVLHQLGFERYVRPEAYTDSSGSSCGSGPSCSATPPQVSQACCSSKLTTETEVEIGCCSASGEAVVSAVKPAPNRWLSIWFATWRDFKQVFPYLMLGVSIGAFIYGFMPTELITRYAGAENWYAIPLAAVIGIPLYIRAEVVIPLSAALVQKGMTLGSVMALIIGSAGASLTELILLKSIFKNQMIAAFLLVVLGMAIGAGYLYGIIWG